MALSCSRKVVLPTEPIPAMRMKTSFLANAYSQSPLANPNIEQISSSGGERRNKRSHTQKNRKKNVSVFLFPPIFWQKMTKAVLQAVLFFFLLSFCVCGRHRSRYAPPNLKGASEGKKLFVFIAQHKTGTHLFRGFHQYLITKFGGDPSGRSCNCVDTPATLSLCFVCSKKEQVVDQVMKQSSIRLIDSVRSPMKAIISQRGYQIRLRENDPTAKTYDHLAASSPFYRAVDSGNSANIWKATADTMHRTMRSMLNVMGTTKEAPNILWVDVDKVMGSYNSSMVSLLAFLFGEAPEPPQQPPPWFVSPKEQEGMVPGLLQLTDAHNANENEKLLHIQDHNEKGLLTKDFFNWLNTSNSLQVRWILEMQAEYEELWRQYEAAHAKMGDIKEGGVRGGLTPTRGEDEGDDLSRIGETRIGLGGEGEVWGGRGERGRREGG